MNYVFCFEISGGCYYSTTYECTAYFIAFLLDFGAAFSFDCPCDPAAQNQSGIGGVDDGVSLHFGNIAIEELQNVIFDIYFHSIRLDYGLKTRKTGGGRIRTAE